MTVSNLPGRQFTGTVARTANALDPTSRTLLVEVHVPNADGALLPGMYAQVDLSSARANPPLLVPSDALIVRADGNRVAVVKAGPHDPFAEDSDWAGLRRSAGGERRAQ